MRVLCLTVALLPFAGEAWPKKKSLRIIVGRPPCLELALNRSAETSAIWSRSGGKRT